MNFLLALFLFVYPAAAAPTQSVQWGYDVVDPHAVQYKVGATWYPMPLFTVANTWAQAQTFSVAPVFSSLTGYVYANGAGALTAATTVPVGSVTNGGTPLLGATNVWTGANSFSTSVTCPTQAFGNNTTNCASTAFVQTAILGGGCYAVAGLPAAGNAGRRTCVNDQLTACPVLSGAFTGGGAVVCSAFDNGTEWVHE